MSIFSGELLGSVVDYKNSQPEDREIIILDQFTGLKPFEGPELIEMYNNSAFYHLVVPIGCQLENEQVVRFTQMRLGVYHNEETSIGESDIEVLSINNHGKLEFALSLRSNKLIYKVESTITLDLGDAVANVSVEYKLVPSNNEDMLYTEFYIAHAINSQTCEICPVRTQCIPRQNNQLIGNGNISSD